MTKLQIIYRWAEDVKRSIRQEMMIHLEKGEILAGNKLVDALDKALNNLDHEEYPEEYVDLIVKLAEKLWEQDHTEYYSAPVG